MQFTRQTDGIAGALKKIAILSEGSALQVANKQEMTHMLFGEAGTFNAMFVTHPPLCCNAYARWNRVFVKRI